MAAATLMDMLTAVLGAATSGPAEAAVALLLAAVLVLCVLAVLARPQRGILALAALVPFDGLLLIMPGGAALAGWKEGLLLATVAASLLARPTRRRPGGDRWPTWAPAAAGFLVVATVSAAIAFDVRGLLGLKIGFFYLLVPCVLWRCPLDRRERDRLVAILLTVGVVTALVGLAQQVVGHERLHELGYEYDDVIRFAGDYLRSFSTFTQPFSFGLFLMVVLLVCLAAAMDQPHRTRSKLTWAMSPLLLAGLASTVVRGAILGLVAGLVLLAFVRHRGLAHALAPVSLAAVFVPPALAATFLSPTSLGERATGWTGTFDLVAEAPLGNGIGTTGSAAEKAVELAPGQVDVLTLSGEPYQPDNYYVKTVLELGPVGLWLLVLLFGSATTAALRVARRVPSPDRGLAEGVAASVVAAAVASLVSTYLEIFPLDVYFWLLLGVLSCTEPASGSTPSPCAQVAAASTHTSASSLPR